VLSDVRGTNMRVQEVGHKFDVNLANGHDKISQLIHSEAMKKLPGNDSFTMSNSPSFTMRTRKRQSFISINRFT